MMRNVQKITELATRFREAIESSDKKKLPIAFQNFPRGSCGDASLLLARLLERNGFDWFDYVLATREGKSHAWLQREDLIVDITADQFSDFNEKVVVTNDSQWHATFVVESKQRADFDKYDEPTRNTLAAAYRVITENHSMFLV
jgi:hypothetical protein